MYIAPFKVTTQKRSQLQCRQKGFYTGKNTAAISAAHSSSFRLFLWHLFKSSATQRHSRHSTDTVLELHAEAPQATVSEGLAQGPYLPARAGVKPMTLQT